MGALLTWLGWRHWRYRKEQTISVLETALLKTTGGEPLPRTRLDRFLTYLQAFLGFILGPMFFLIGVIVILGEMGLL
jgi:hypothetical protein